MNRNRAGRWLARDRGDIIEHIKPLDMAEELFRPLRKIGELPEQRTVKPPLYDVTLTSRMSGTTRRGR